MRFEKPTGKFELVPGGAGVKRPVREAFDKDVLSFSIPMFADYALPISQCFDKGPQPSFYSGSHRWLTVRETGLRLVGLTDTKTMPAILSVSPIGFSHDGRWAVLYAEYDCTGFCGGGGFSLFEQRNGTWKFVGTNWIWGR